MRERFPNWLAFLMLGVGLMLDIAELLWLFVVVLPGVGFVLYPIGSFLFAGVCTTALLIFYKMRGVKFIDRRGAKLVAATVTFLVQWLPFMGWLPGWTLNIWAVIWLTRREDRKERERLQEDRAAQAREQERTRAQQYFEHPGVYDAARRNGRRLRPAA